MRPEHHVTAIRPAWQAIPHISPDRVISIVLDSTQCKDDFDNCAYLALTGACEKYQDWMNRHCGVSCNMCKGTYYYSGISNGRGEGWGVKKV